MKPTPHTPIDRVRKSLAFGLAALLTASFASGQTADADALRRLQEENAALRRQLAELQGRPQAATPAAPATTTTPSSQPAPVAPAATTAPAASEPGVVSLSPFEVSSDRDYGYLKTNSATATRIGMPIQKIPLSVSVVSDEFIKDAGMRDISDLLRYQASSAGDNRMGILQPATSFTPSGGISLRAYPINARLRNGLLRYNNYTLDNVERVEIIKGPAAIFFGMAFPGGVINYITKKPQLHEIPTAMTISYGGEGDRMGSVRGTLDHNAVLSGKAALRVVGAWDNILGDARNEYQKGFSVAPSLTLVPLSSGKLNILLEGEYVKRTRNLSDESWRWDERWFEAYANPSAALIAAAPDAVRNAADPVAAYRDRIRTNIGNWITDYRIATGDPTAALWRSLDRGAVITDAAGNRVRDEKFNYWGPHSFSDEESTTFSLTADLAATKWLDVRYNLTMEKTIYHETKAFAQPNADGTTWNALNGLVKRDYIPDFDTQQLDLVFKGDFFKMKHRMLAGAVDRYTYVRYTGNNGHTNINPFYGYLPGTFDKPDEGYVSPIPPEFRPPSNVAAGWGYTQQFVRDRNGKIITPQQIFSNYDPAVHPFPDVNRIMEVSRGLIDRGRQWRDEWYLNYQGSAFEDRLTVMLGYREEKYKSSGQVLAANGPWFEVHGSPYTIPDEQWTMYGLSNFSLPSSYKGDSKMAGVSFDIAKDVTLYASYSETYLPTTIPNIGGGYNPVEVSARATSLGLNPTTELARLDAQGANKVPVHEAGKNSEIGVKFNLNDGKIVSTVSLYRLDRANRMLDDSAAQTGEPLNWTGPGNTGSYSRLIRWYNNSSLSRSEGLEIETIWTPIRNYQAVISGSWMWKAAVLDDITINPSSAIGQIYFGERMPNAPEYRLNVMQKYTFTDGRMRGLTLGLGARYSSKINISTSDMNFNPRNGGLTAGDYLVFDGSISYPFEVLGYRMRTSVRGTNLLDEEYSEGSYNLAPARGWWLSLDMTF